jgi:hypothetical protein
MSITFESEAEAFVALKETRRSNAAQRAAVFLALGTELDDILGAGGEARTEAARQLERKIRRERIRGLRQPWDYDLDRHIALSRALRRIMPRGGIGRGNRGGYGSDRGAGVEGPANTTRPAAAVPDQPGRKKMGA